MKTFKQKLNKLFFYQKYVFLGENTFIHCIQITVVHIRVNVFLLNSPSVSCSENKRNQIRKLPKKNDKHAAEYSKNVCCDVN